MNFTTIRGITQASRPVAAVAVAAATLSCGSQSRSSGPAPVSPDATVVAFLSAVRSGDLQDMSELWGNARGLAADQMDSETLEQRLTITRIYLEHQAYAIIERPPDAVVSVASDEQVVWVRLTRRGCAPIVPFTLTRFGDRWLIRNVDLEAVGNPERQCSAR